MIFLYIFSPAAEKEVGCKEEQCEEEGIDEVVERWFVDGSSAHEAHGKGRKEWRMNIENEMIGYSELEWLRT